MFWLYSSINRKIVIEKDKKLEIEKINSDCKEKSKEYHNFVSRLQQQSADYYKDLSEEEIIKKYANIRALNMTNEEKHKHKLCFEDKYMKEHMIDLICQLS